MDSDLKSKIENKTAQISVIGAGYVGLPLAIAFASAGFHVCTIDNDESKVNTINSGESYIGDISSESIKYLSPQVDGCSHYLDGNLLQLNYLDNALLKLA